ncbi:MAG: energy transducer TonB [Sphingomonas sp.]|uniref:energy transducer TonB n=1 Tax=Sphingomonas sp. TaxID=28214 RepID=UPI003F7F78E5
MVSLIVAGFGYAFVTGLAMDFAKKAAEKLNAFDVAPPPPPPPPDKPPPPPPDQPNLPPPPTQVVIPPITPPVVTNNNIATTNVIPPAPAPVIPPAPPAQPAPPAPPRIAVRGGPRGNPGNWFTNEDYPSDAKRAGAQGRVTVVLSIDTSGKVAGCRVTSGSGNSSLDDATCRLAQRRGRFTVQKDADGNAQPYSYTLPGIKWQLQDE